MSYTWDSRCHHCSITYKHQEEYRPWQNTWQSSEIGSTLTWWTTVWSLQQLHWKWTIPSSWKRSSIKLIPKSPWAFAPKDFRPVALTAVVAKVFERLLLRFITPYLTDRQQYAYQPNKSTEDVLAYLLDTVTSHLDRHAKNNLPGVCL